MTLLPAPATTTDRSWRDILRHAFTRPSRLQISIATIVTMLVLWASFALTYHDRPISEYIDTLSKKFPYGDITQAARNETLGFSKIFYISMPHRTDRQDQMSLMASRTNLTLELHHGVNGTKMSVKAKPGEEQKLRPEQWGCWRGHADLWQKVLNEKLETALILEDDLDWDPNLHDIMVELGRQMRRGMLRATGLSDYERKNAPYGLDWDILHLGICYDGFEPKKRYHLYNDPNAPGRQNISSHFVAEITARGVTLTNSTTKRLITPSWNPSCTIAYAVTHSGAQRLLYNIGGVKQIFTPVDLAMADQEKNGWIKGYTILPPVITTWKVGGVMDSDIDDLKEQEKKGFQMGSENLRNSMRRSLEGELGNNLKSTEGYWY